MELKEQVVSLELAKKLKELGVEQESLFYWSEFEDYTGDVSKYIVVGADRLDDITDDCISAFTVAELGEKLKNKNVSFGYIPEQWVTQHTGEAPVFLDSTEANSRAKMLIDILENKLI